MQSIYLTIALAPLAAAIMAGLFGRIIGRAGAHTVTIGAVALSCALSMYVLWKFMARRHGAVRRHRLHLAGQRWRSRCRSGS